MHQKAGETTSTMASTCTFGMAAWDPGCLKATLSKYHTVKGLGHQCAKNPQCDEMSRLFHKRLNTRLCQ